MIPGRPDQSSIGLPPASPSRSYTQIMPLCDTKLQQNSANFLPSQFRSLLALISDAETFSVDPFFRRNFFAKHFYFTDHIFKQHFCCQAGLPSSLAGGQESGNSAMSALPSSASALFQLFWKFLTEASKRNFSERIKKNQIKVWSAIRFFGFRSEFQVSFLFSRLSFNSARYHFL